VALHGGSGQIAALRQRVIGFIDARLGSAAPLGRTLPADQLEHALAGAITPDGLGIERAWALFESAVDANTIALDGPRYLAFIPMSPSGTAVWFDALVGAASYSAESWLEAAGAVAAENQALELLRTLTGMPAGTAGCFTFGGSNGNLSALAVARDVARDTGDATGRRLVAVADTAHASIDNALHLLGMDSLVVPTGDDGRFTGAALDHALHGVAAGSLAAVVASAGSTNAGVVDDLAGLADAAHRHRAWLHVDGAYGGAALILPEQRHRFAGIEHADSFIVDPHKWFFSTAGACALLYRRPELARATHTQHGPYIDVIHAGDAALAWNPSDHAFQLTRRASGLPFWMTLVLHGTDAMTEAVRAAMVTTAYAADQLRSMAGIDLVMEPELSVLLFRKTGWDHRRWREWAADLLERQVAFVAPTTWKGETVGRLVFLHPLTTTAIVDEVLDSLC
jgi:aromatic-L-amino-acid decarboxylase